MRVVITGGLGHIGSHLAGAYLAQGDEVWICDDRRAHAVTDVPGARVMFRTIGGLDAVPTNGVDLVVHCAAPVGSVGVLEVAGNIASEILASTHAVIGAARVAGARVVNVSTSEVYGFSGTYSETDDCVIRAGASARREYALGKLAAEYALANHVARGDLEAITVRPFNVAGPGQSRAKGFVLPTFCEQALAGEALTVHGDGCQQRAFTAVWDVCRFITDHAEEARWQSEVYNLGHPGNRISIGALAELVLERSGSSSPVAHVDPREIHGQAYAEADGVVKVPHVERARSLGWFPEIDLTELVDLTLASTERVEVAA